MTPRLEDHARELVTRMTPAERLRLLAGDHDLYRDLLNGSSEDYKPPLCSADALPRLGLRGLRFVDGPRGVARGVSTCFPVAIARAASFDYGLEERVGEAIGREARAQGANVCLAPCLNLLHALTDVVLGREKPSGRLPFAIPTDADHLPSFDPDAEVVVYDGPHGQALLDHLGESAAYPYGFGLTYELDR